MIYRRPLPLKKTILWFFIAAFGGGVSFIILLALTSIKVGIGNTNQDGFVIPVLAGVFSIVACIFLFLWVFKIVLSLMKEKDLFI
jgi:hypothetical protein